MKAIISVAAAILFLAVVSSGCTAKAKQDRYLKQATEHFEAGDYDKARIAYLNLLRGDPQNAVAIQKLGQIWFENGAPLEALRYLSLAPVLMPADFDTRAKLAACYLSLGHPAEARKEAMTILEQSPGHDEAIQILAETVRSQPELDETMQIIEGGAQPDKASRHLAIATLHLRKRDREAAEKEILRGLSLDPKSVLGHMAMALVWWSKGNPEKADAEFKTAVELAGPRHLVGVKYADFKVKNNARDEAKAILNGITAKTPDFLPAWLFLAKIAMDEKKYDDGLAYLKNILARDIGNVDAQILQATIWIERGEAARAEQALVALDKEQRTLPNLKYQLARAALQNNNLNLAGSAAEDALALNPDSLDAQILLASVNLRRGDAKSVAKAMETLLKARPNLLQPQLLLIDAYRALDRQDDAAALVRQQIAADPKNATPHFMLGVILRQKGQIDEAADELEKAYALAPENTTFLSQIVDLEIARKRFPEALQRVEAALKTTPNSGNLHFLEGKIHWAQGIRDRAEKAFVKALEIDAAQADAPALLTAIYVSDKKFTEARAVVERVLARTPTDAGALRAAALIYEQLNELEKARDAYEKILTLSPGDHAVMNNLAYLYSEKLNNLDRARDLALKARSLQPSDAGTADTLGWILFKQGEYPQALALLQESAVNLGDNPEVQYHLGMASYMMGQVGVARAALEKAAAATQDFPGKSEIPAKLALLSSGASPSMPVPIEQIEALVKDRPQDPLLRIQLGDAHTRGGDSAKAAAAYEQALTLNPALTEPALKLAKVYAGSLNNKQKAMEYAKKAQALAPNDAAVAGVLGALAYESGNHPWAYSLLGESSRKRPQDATILRDFAWAAYSTGRVDEGQLAMERLLKVAPDSALASEAKSFIAIVGLDSDSERLSGAQPEIEALLQTNPKYLPALMAQAALSLRRGDSKAAGKIYADVLQLFPDFTPAMKRLAALLMGDPATLSKADDLARKARRAFPDDPEIAQILAAISYEKKDYSYARQLLEESARKRPLDARSLYYLGMIHFHAKEKVQSREVLKQALAAGLEESLAARAAESIKELETE